ncbi:MAG: class I SAM-dependent methyltransferase [Planctomycetota bacterium]
MPRDVALLDTEALPEFRNGVPTLAELDALKASDFYGELKSYSDAFLQQHDAALRGYGRHWGDDPMRLWSRRFEYPFAAAAVMAHADRVGRTDLVCCDAGSGVTFLPYLLAERLDGATFACCDPNTTYAKMFAAVNQKHDGRVTYDASPIQKLPFDDGGLDVLMCVSVLEHTGDYATVVDEMARVVKPGGRLVLTFDLGLDGKFELLPASSKLVLDRLGEHFVLDLEDLKRQADEAYHDATGLLSTPEVKAREPEHLPWKYPRLQAMYDLVRGYGWTGGFRSVAPMCLDLQRQ